MAAGVLLELGFAETVDQAVAMVKEIRPEVTIHPEFKKDLERLFGT
ncbi:hypothetical protein [Alkalicoccus saliphilus]|nr:hypothetical protein [Alkalicoccus saliphilus]